MKRLTKLGLGCVVAGAVGASASMLWAADYTLNAPDTVKDTVASASLLIDLPDERRTDPQDVLAAAQADYARLLAALYEQGYFAPRITITINGREATSYAPVSPPTRINTVTINVKPGESFTFGTAEVRPVARDTTLPSGFATGEPARVSVMRDAVGAAIKGWRNDGHAKAEAAQQSIVARHPDKKLDASVAIAPGPRLTFGTLIIQGNEDVTTRRLRKIADLPRGEQFSPKTVETVATRLRRTGAFKSVAITEAERIGPNNTLDLTVQVSEQPKRRIGFGADISTQEGLGASAFWLHRNLLGGAERLRFDASISGIGGQTGGIDYKLAARFERPATFNADTNFYAQTAIERLDEPNFQADSFTIEAGITRIASRERTYELGLGFLAANTTDDFGERSYRLVTLPLKATFDYRDDRLNATSGFYVSAELTPFAGLAGSDSGARLYTDARAYYTLGEARPVTLAGRVQLGSLIGPDVDEAYPDYLFFSGGGGTVRGQPYQSLGVTLPTGQTVGGKSFVGLSAEARFKAFEKISIVGFVDAGYIDEGETAGGQFGEWHTGAGLGLRYDTGIGPIRLDLAVPVSGPGKNSGFEVYIGIGQAF